MKPPRIPRGPAAVLKLLRLSAPELAELSPADWQQALEYADRQHLTLPLAAHADMLPDWVAQRLRGNQEATRARFGKLQGLYREIADTFAATSIEHAMLKGFSHWPHLTSNPALRQQYDIDLCVPKESALRARDVLLELGYSPITGFEESPLDHLPTMVRKTAWEWRGDYFDPEIPVSVDLHFRFWDAETEGFAPDGIDDFWARREVRTIGNGPVATLNAVDTVAYACLHALRHLLRGDAKAGHIYEIAWMLERREDPAFWQQWRRQHSDNLRQMQAIVFRFAAAWFDCRLPAAAREEAGQLPAPIGAWFDRYAASPLEVSFRPNKDELWLHLSLIETAERRRAILIRRLIPIHLPPAVDGAQLSPEQLTPARRRLIRARYATHVVRRACTHLLVLLPGLAQAVRWKLHQQEIGSGFWGFLLAGSLFNLALFLYYLLYPLYLLELGFHEDFIGNVASAFTLGSMAGSLAGGIAGVRLGLGRVLVASFLMTSIAMVLRVIWCDPPALLATGFVGGMATVLWMVSLAPAVAELVPERSRPFAFSLTFSSGIALGVAGGLAGGRLPEVFHSKRSALLLAAALAAVAAIGIARVSLPRRSGDVGRVFEFPPVLVRYLVVLAVWSLANGAFNPFFGPYFTQVQHFAVDRVGLVFSASQLAQSVAVLVSPLLLQRLGLMRGIAAMQVATAIALAFLAGAPPWLAASAYAAYMSFQFMSEPGMYSVLMNGVSPAGRSGASAMNFLLIFGAQALAATAAGWAITRTGYSPVLLVAAALALVAALLWWRLLRDASPR